MLTVTVEVNWCIFTNHVCVYAPHLESEEVLDVVEYALALLYGIDDGREVVVHYHLRTKPDEPAIHKQQ